MTETKTDHTASYTTSPFEVVYTALYLFSLAGIGLDLWRRIGASQTDAMIIVSGVFGLFVCFQYLRMYAVLHSFDRLNMDTSAHFVKCVAGLSRHTDRVIRLILASLLILATKFPPDASLLRLRLSRFIETMQSKITQQGSFTSAIDSAVDMRYDLVTVYAFWLTLVFLFLILWDINMSVRLRALRSDQAALDRVAATAQKFFYLPQEQWAAFVQTRFAYFATRKFWERVCGLTVALGALACSAQPTMVLTFLTALPLGVFGYFVFTYGAGSVRTVFMIFFVVKDYLTYRVPDSPPPAVTAGTSGTNSGIL